MESKESLYKKIRSGQKKDIKKGGNKQWKKKERETERRIKGRTREN